MAKTYKSLLSHVKKIGGELCRAAKADPGIFRGP